MAKNTFATLGIFLTLLLGLTLTSAALDNFELSIVGEGTSSDRLTGSNDSQQSFTINLDNALSESVYVNWSVATTTTMDVPAGRTYAAGFNDSVTDFVLTIPYKASSYVRLTANVYNEDQSTEIGTEYINIYFNNTDYIEESTEISGCTDSNANNYDSDATTDDGSCTYDVTADTFCELEGTTETGKLEISDFDINNNGEGSDDEWEYLDKIEITVEVENTDSDDIEDVEVEIAIYDNKIQEGGNDVTNDFDFEDEVLTDIGKLKDGDEESVTFLIEELPADLDDGTYYMYIRAYEDGNEAENCRSEIDSGDYYFEFTIESVDDEEAVTVRGKELTESIDAYCGQKNLEVTVPVYNLGDDDEEKVLVNLYNANLGIDEFIVIDDLDNGDKEIVSFFVNIPEALENDKYNLDVIVSFDWDDDEDEDDPFAYDEETSDTSIRLNIIGCTAQAPSITATLGSEMKVGENLIVKAIIKNNEGTNDFIITPTGFESWADLVSVSPQTLTIASGNTQEVTITLLPKTSGTQTFTINTLVDGETFSQPVSVRIAEEPGMFDGLFGESNLTLYLIAGIAILVILILLVAIIKVAQRPARKAEF